MSTKIEIAAEIFSQLGGNKFRAVTGATGFSTLSDKNGIRFMLKNSRISNGVKFCYVILEPLDTYRLEFYDCKAKKIKEVSSIYCDQLRAVFEDETELRTSL